MREALQTTSPELVSTLPAVRTAPAEGTAFRTLSLPARIYVAAVIAAGGLGLLLLFPDSLPRPWLFLLLGVFSCLTSTWKVVLPISVANGSTLSVSYAANVMAFLLLGLEQAMLIAVAGVLTQCTYKPKQPYPAHRTLFSMAAAVITMAATGAMYTGLGGPIPPHDSFALARPVVAAIATYFLVNTSLVAGAIALSTSRSFARTWRRDFLWSGASFMVAGSAGAVAAVVVQRGEHWKALLLVAPIYLTYRTYELFAGRLEDQKRHTDEIRRMHEETVDALGQARAAERALASEKERLAAALAEMTRLEELQNQLLVREQAVRASAEEANRLKDEFLAIVSHELRTPLNSILGWADMLTRGTLEPALRTRAAQMICQSAKRQARLVEDLLDIARITSGKLRLERTFVDFNDIVRDALHIAQPGADAKRIRVAFDADCAVGSVYGDTARLQQIVSNLLSNAVKFTPEGGAIHVRLRNANNGIELVVTDTGQGIPREFLPNVFEAFRQADGSTTRVHSGLGLGLAIVKNLVEAHSGTVSVHSGGEGKGATFIVRLPVAVSPDAVEPAHPRLAPPALPPVRGTLEGLSVLVVDDDEDSREVVAAHLHGHRAEVLTAGSAAHAMDLLARENVDVLLADIGMPDEDGYALIRRVRSLQLPQKADIPAAALTAFARDEDRQRALKAGFQLHIAKPVDAASLVAAVASLGRMKATSARRMPPSPV